MWVMVQNAGRQQKLFIIERKCGVLIQFHEMEKNMFILRFWEASLNLTIDANEIIRKNNIPVGLLKFLMHKVFLYESANIQNKQKSKRSCSPCANILK